MNPMRWGWFFVAALAAFNLVAQSAAANSPQALMLQGTILNPAGLPQEDASVAFTVELRSPGAENCLLYSESHTLNMTNSGGAFSLPIGSGTRSGAGFQATSTLADVFDNGASNITGLTCTTGTSYDPIALHSRKIQITFDDGSGPQTLTQTLSVQSVPYALYADSAKTLGPLGPTDFLQTNILTGLTQSNVDSVFASNANVVELLALIAGTSSQYAKSAGAQTFSGAVSLTSAGTGLSVTNNVAIGGTTSIGGVTSITNATASTNSTSGAVVVTGGLGVGGAINAGTTMSAGTSLMTPIIYGSSAASGTLTLQSTSDATKGSILINPEGGSVGIGTAGPLSAEYKLQVISTSTMASGNSAGIQSNLAVDPIAASTATNYALLGEVSHITGTNSGDLVGVRGHVFKSATGSTASSMTGAHMSVQRNEGNVTTMTGTANQIFNGGSQAVTTMKGIDNSLSDGGNSTSAYGSYNSIARIGVGTTTSAYGVSANISQALGTITNAYGVHVGTIQGTNKWSIYASDAAVPSYFAGSVGIGTSNPSAALTVNGDTHFTNAADRSISVRPTSGITVGKSLTVAAGSTTGTLSAGGLNLAGGDAISGTNGGDVNVTGGFGFNIGGTVSISGGQNDVSVYSNVLIAPNGGNVGIGTASPTSLLHVVQPSASGNLANAFTVVAGSSSGANGNGGGISLQTGAGNATGNGGAFSLTGGQGGASGGTGGALTFSGGNGTTGYGATLSIGGGGHAGGGGSLILTAGQSGNGFDAAHVVIDGGVASCCATPLPGNVLIASNRGNVGIGVATPGSKLQVGGDITPSGMAPYDIGSTALRWNTIYLSNAPDVSSDARLKKEVKTSDLGLDFINSLRPVSWIWKDQRQGAIQHYGVIAQEAELAIAKAKGQDASNVIVTHDEVADSYSVRYTELISPLIKAIQDLYIKVVITERDIASIKTQKAEQEALDAANAKIEKLEAENAAMKERLDKIERTLQSK